MTDLVAYGVVDHVIDGDTLVVSSLAVGLGVGLVHERVRVAEINAPELHTPEGDAALVAARALVVPGAKVTVLSPGPMGTRDNYGRVLGKVQLPDGRDWGTVMVAAGHAVPFMVGGQPAHPPSPHPTVADGHAAQGRR